MSSSPPTEAPVLLGPISLEEFLSWGETDAQYELVDGWVVVNPARSRVHQYVIRSLLLLLDAAAPEGMAAFPAPLDWVLRSEPPTVRQPDLVVAPLAGGPNLTEAPLLAVEILSPGGNERDLVTKRLEYAAAGLRHYWVVDPEVPAVVVFGGDDLREVARAVGDDRLTLTEPFAVSVLPAALVLPRHDG